ncbi:hypothetical protein C7U60_09325 [Mesorhizobium plurifarium]|uniref:hypothetical protein n=1 Tax=Sinorhizobium arboris TaxID=76745 RepID=UPI000408AE79|nr:hypothetical protein [Sinorhizobium arboris]PST24120.1 hypothetical protein C7U60_09325 [Mesorhizobium plurifarium]
MNADKMRVLIEDCRRDLFAYLEPGSGISDREMIVALLHRLDGLQARDALGEDFDWPPFAPEGSMEEQSGRNRTSARLRIILNRRLR